MAELTSSVSVTATIKKSSSKPTLQMQTIRFIIAVLGCCGSAFTFLTCFDTGVNGVLVFALIAGICLVSTAYRLRKEIACTALALSAVGCISAAIVLRNSFSAGLAGFVNMYSSLAWEKYRENPIFTITEPELADEHMAGFVILSVIIIYTFACYMFVRCDAGLYSLSLLIAPTIPVFAIGLEPHPIAFTALVSAVAGLVVHEFTTSNTVHNQQFLKYGMQCAAVATAVSALCLGLVFGFTKITGYERPQALNNVFDKADTYLNSGELQNDIMETFSQLTGDYYVYGAINHGKLDEFGKIRFEFTKVLQVTMPRSADTVYLRGFVGSVYTGRSWEELSAGKLSELEEITEGFSTSGLSPLLFDGYNLKNAPAILPNYSFTVKNIAANPDYLYMPYNLVPESVSRYTIVDNSYFKGTSTTYFGQVYDPDSYHGYQNLFRKRWSIPSSLVGDEAAYRNFVYENYLELPDTFSPEGIFTQNYYEYITAEEIQTGKSTLDEMTVFSRKLYYIKDWLRDNCTYSLTTEPLPKGKDFVNHFLEHKEGSCSHFATTAVLMCRYAGIPARYVEGYVITPHDVDKSIPVGATVTVDVEDTHGHAWVEVYIDGYGWYPMEFTSGYGNVRTAFPTETTVTETEPVTEISSEETSETPFETDNEETAQTAPQPQGNTTETTVTQNNESTTSAAVTTVPSETIEEPQSQNDDGSNSQSIGFGIFGIEGEKQVDVVYDLTWVLVIVLVIAAIPTAVILRRIIIISSHKSAISPAERVNYDYRRFCKLIKLMNMPEQGAMSYSEYEEALSQRSPLLSDGNASRIISFALKASFGGNSITRDEAHEMQATVTTLAKRYYASLSVWGKFKMRFIYCII